MYVKLLNTHILSKCFKNLRRVFLSILLRSRLSILKLYSNMKTLGTLSTHKIYIIFESHYHLICVSITLQLFQSDPEFLVFLISIWFINSYLVHYIIIFFRNLSFMFFDLCYEIRLGFFVIEIHLEHTRGHLYFLCQPSL